MEFNGIKPTVIHLDINSCFATIEQQANPNLRDKAIAVAAYTTNSGCILAASVTAKRMGIKTGMSVGDAKQIHPRLIVLTPDPPKYRFVHKAIKKILKDYSSNVIPKSIDEFVFHLDLPSEADARWVSCEIKQRIKKEVGEYVTVSIGISTNRYLAKIASNLQKPDGLSLIDEDNYLEVFQKLKLTDLTGIKKGNSARLKLYGINTVVEFFNAPVWKLKLAFGGIVGLYWHTWLHGFETCPSLRTEIKQKTYGNSYAPPANKAHLTLEILSKLCEKTGYRLRNAGLFANGVHLAISYRDGSFWHKGVKTKKIIIDNNDIYKEAAYLLKESPSAELPRVIAVNVYNLNLNKNLQLDIFSDQIKKTKLSDATDKINNKWGLYTIHSARMTMDSTVVQDRISFGQL
jgi:DNA polymerase-4